MSNPIDNYNKIVTTVNSVTSDYTFEADANNLIVIDTSNNRIGINTVHPQRSIHISGGDVSSGIITPYLQMISGGEGVGSDFIPSQDNIYTLGSESKQWKDLYVGPGSIYMNKKRIFSLDSNNNLNLNISGDGLKLDSNLDISGYIHNTNDILNNVNISGNVVPTSDNKYSLGDNTKGWSDLYIKDGGIYLKNQKIIYFDENNILTISSNQIQTKNSLTVNGTFSSSQSVNTNNDIGGGNIYGTMIGKTANGALNICGGFFSTLDAAQNSTFQQDLIVENDISVNQKLKVGSDVSLNANVDISNHLTVLGDVSLNSNVDISNHLTVFGDVSLNDNVDISNHLTVFGDVSLNDNVDISNHLTVLGDVSLNDNVKIGNHLTVLGDVSLNDNVDISNHLTVLGDVSLNANVDISNHLTVLNGDVSFNNNVKIGNHLTVLGDVSLNDNVDISNHLTVLGDVSLNANVDISNHLTVLGDVSLNSKVDISNHLTVLGDVSLNSNVDISNHLTVLNGDVSFNNNVKIGNHLTVLGDVSLNSNVDICGNVTINSGVGSSDSNTGALIVTGGVGISENLNVGGDISGNINANMIADKSVSNTEFQYLNGVTSTIQTQLNTIPTNNNQLTNGSNYSTFTMDTLRGIYYHPFDYHGSSATEGPNPGTTGDGGIQRNLILINQGWRNWKIYASVSNPSDDRLKHNEIHITNGLDIIRQLKPQKYQKTLQMKEADYNGDISGYWHWESGFIAQEILEINDLKYIVKGGDRIDDSGNIVPEIYHLEGYKDIFVYNVQATKELDTIVQTQQNKINNLEAENTLIKNALNELLRDAGKPNV